MINLKKYLIMFAIALSLGGAASVADAYYVSYSSASYGCRWVPGHWRHGYWVPGHKVCWGRRGPACRVVPGHWYHGYWVAPHRVCR